MQGVKREESDANAYISDRRDRPSCSTSPKPTSRTVTTQSPFPFSQTKFVNVFVNDRYSQNVTFLYTGRGKRKPSLLCVWASGRHIVSILLKPLSRYHKISAAIAPAKLKNFSRQNLTKCEVAPAKGARDCGAHTSASKHGLSSHSSSVHDAQIVDSGFGFDQLLRGIQEIIQTYFVPCIT